MWSGKMVPMTSLHQLISTTDPLVGNGNLLRSIDKHVYWCISYWWVCRVGAVGGSFHQLFFENETTGTLYPIPFAPNTQVISLQSVDHYSPIEIAHICFQMQGETHKAQMQDASLWTRWNLYYPSLLCIILVWPTARSTVLKLRWRVHDRFRCQKHLRTTTLCNAHRMTIHWHEFQLQELGFQVGRPCLERVI